MYLQAGSNWHNAKCHYFKGGKVVSKRQMIVILMIMAVGIVIASADVYSDPHIVTYIRFQIRAICVPFYGVGSTRLSRTPAFHAFLSCGSTATRPQLLTSIFTHSHHIFLDVFRPLVLRIRTSVTGFTQDLAHCTCPHHMSRRLWRTGVISPMPSFCNRKLRVLHTSDVWHTSSAREGIPIILLPVFVQTPVIRNW